jgi:hypothetical protein
MEATGELKMSNEKRTSGLGRRDLLTAIGALGLSHFVIRRVGASPTTSLHDQYCAAPVGNGFTKDALCGAAAPGTAAGYLGDASCGLQINQTEPTKHHMDTACGFVHAGTQAAEKDQDCDKLNEFGQTNKDHDCGKYGGGVSGVGNDILWLDEDCATSTQAGGAHDDDCTKPFVYGEPGAQSDDDCEQTASDEDCGLAAGGGTYYSDSDCSAALGLADTECESQHVSDEHCGATDGNGYSTDHDCQTGGQGSDAACGLEKPLVGRQWQDGPD